MTPIELAENQACEALAQAVACEHSPAVPGSHEAAAIHAAEEIARRIQARQERALDLIGPEGESVEAELQKALTLLVHAADELVEPGEGERDSRVVEAVESARDRVARALAQVSLEAEKVR